MMFTPTGIATKVSAASLFQFTSLQKEGVLAVINQSSTLGFAALTNASGTLKKNYVPILPSSVQYLAFGDPYNSIDVTGAELLVLPGLQVKKNIPFVSVVDILRMIPHTFLIPFPEYLRQNLAGTIPVTTNDQTAGLVLEISGNNRNFNGESVFGFVTPKYKYNGISRSLRSNGNGAQDSSVIRRSLVAADRGPPLTRVSGLYLDYPNLDAFFQKIFGTAGTDSVGFKEGLQLTIAGTPFIENGVILGLPAPGEQYYNRNVVFTEIYNGANSTFMAGKDVRVDGDTGSTSFIAPFSGVTTAIMANRVDQMNGGRCNWFGTVEFYRVATMDEIFTCIDFFQQIMEGSNK